MKPFFTLSFLFVFTVRLAFSQEQEVSALDSLPFDFRKQLFIYTTAKRYSDPVVSRVALYNILAYNPANVAILDSLALSYAENRQYPSALLAAQDALQVNPDDMLATKIAAISFYNLGLKEKALPHYEKWYLDNNDIGILYQIAFMQLDLKRFNEATASADILIKNPEATERKLVFQKTQTENQEIPILAAAYRIKGMIASERGNTEEAKEYLNKALEVAPDFEIVKAQLKKLDEGQ